MLKETKALIDNCAVELRKSGWVPSWTDLVEHIQVLSIALTNASRGDKDVRRRHYLAAKQQFAAAEKVRKKAEEKLSCSTKL